MHRRPATFRIWLKRFVLSAFIVCSCSVISFYIACERRHEPSAMLVVIGLFIAAYTLTLSTRWYANVTRWRGVKRTLQIGYAIRVLLALTWSGGIFVDLLVGLVSTGLVESVLGMQLRTWMGTFTTTLLDAIVQHVVLGGFMLLIFPLVRALSKPSVDDVRGFEVIPTATRADISTHV